MKPKQQRLFSKTFVMESYSLIVCDRIMTKQNMESSTRQILLSRSLKMKNIRLNSIQLKTQKKTNLMNNSLYKNQKRKR